jgi:opacity protein-like surface antigen
MSRSNRLACAAGAVVAALLLASVTSAVHIETVHVGNGGNWPDPKTGVGTVKYEYNIGKYEVTAGQYSEFLNAVAGADTFGLYNPDMWFDPEGCKIERSGSGTARRTSSRGPARPGSPTGCITASRPARRIRPPRRTGRTS